MNRIRVIDGTLVLAVLACSASHRCRLMLTISTIVADRARSDWTDLHYRSSLLRVATPNHEHAPRR